MSAAVRHKNPRRAMAVERLLARIPQRERASLPRVLAEYQAGSAFKRPTIEACAVYLPQCGQAMPDRGGAQAAAKLPELDEHYKEGWKFAFAEDVEQGASLEVYMWRAV